MNILTISIICVVIISTALLIYYFAFYRKKHVPIKHKEYYNVSVSALPYFSLA